MKSWLALFCFIFATSQLLSESSESLAKLKKQGYYTVQYMSGPEERVCQKAGIRNPEKTHAERRMTLKFSDQG